MCFAFVVTTSEYVQLCKLASRRCALDIRLCYDSFGPRKGGHWKMGLGEPGVGLGRLRLGLPGAAAMGGWGCLWGLGLGLPGGPRR